MSDDDMERSESGDRIYRHAERKREWALPEHPAEYLEDINSHVEKYVGKIETVFHELLSDLVHLDVFFVPATKDRPYHVLVTSGMSDEPMTVPEGMEAYVRAELMIALPADWPLTQEAFQDELNWWPVRWLKTVGRLPHEYDTWVGWGHTIPNGDPPERIANTNFVGVMLTQPHGLAPEFYQLTTKNGETIWFYNMVPLYKEEMDLKLKIGAEELAKKFDEHGIGFVLENQRKNVAKRRGWFW